MDEEYKCYEEAKEGNKIIYTCERSHYITDKFIMSVFNIRQRIHAFWLPYDVLMGISGEIPLCCILSWVKYYHNIGDYHGKKDDRKMALERGGYDSSRNVSFIPCKYHSKQRDGYNVK